MSEISMNNLFDEGDVDTFELSDNPNSWDEKLAAAIEGSEPEVKEEVVDEEEVEAKPEDQAKPVAKPQEKEPVEEEKDEEEEPVQGKRAQKRIQSLVSEKKALAEQLEQQNKRFSETAAQYEQRMNQQLQAVEQRYAQQLAFAERQMKALAAEREQLQARKQQEEEANLSELDRFKLGLKREAVSEAEAKMKTELTQFQKQFLADKQAREKAVIEEQKRVRFETAMKQVDDASNKVLFDGFPQEEAAKFDEVRSMVLARMAAYGETPEQATQAFKQFLDAYADTRALVRSKVKTAAPKPGVSKRSLPAAPSQSVSEQPLESKTMTKSGMPKATQDQLNRNGFSNYFEWMEAGHPPLK